ncbi:MAG: efflux RND transporter periplasmic adaptor subunit [Sneathiella sp.]|nr:efflux RND transporter periplasmic adaptor subunit [Sneathiella sp.]
MKITTQFALLAAIGAMGFLGWTYQENIPFLGEKTIEQKSSRGGGGRPSAVIAAPAVRSDLVSIVTAVGTLEANQSVELTTKVAGVIEEISFEEGAVIAKGEVLVRLDDTEARAAVAESRAELENSQKLYERTLKLYKSGNAPKARVDLELSELKVSEAKVSADRARLADFVIDAPFEGVLGFREVSVGSLVRPGDMITTLDDVKTLKLDFGLPEAYLAAIKPGQAFFAKSVAYEGRVFKGQVTTIGSRVDPVTRIVRVRGEIPNEDGALRPGMYLSVSLQTGVDEGSVLVPEHAVLVSPKGASIFVVQDETAKQIDVTLGQRRKGWVQVVSGVQEDDVVVIEGLQKIRDGSKLKVTLEERVFQDEKALSEVTQ